MTRGLFKTASGIAVAAAAGMLATGAMAADLGGYGGDCCADLEERVAELEATTARKGNRKVSLTVYGQVNKQILWHDSDQWDAYRSDKLTVRDNSAAQTRFGFRGEAQIRPGLTAGYLIEVGLSENKSGGDELAIRHSFAYLDSDRLGRLSIGHTSQVTDGLYEINLANSLRTPGTINEASNFLGDRYSATFKTPFDGGRKQGVYYRTPSIAGFMLAAGWSHDKQDSLNDADDAWEVALRYAGEFNGVRLAAGVGYRKEEANTPYFWGAELDRSVWLGSASVMHTPTGLFVSGGLAQAETSSWGGTGLKGKQDGFWVMAGIERNFFGPGATTLFAEYSEVGFNRTAKIFDNREDGNFWGLGVVQKIDAAATDLYLQFRNYELDGRRWNPANRASEDASVFTGGMIIRF